MATAVTQLSMFSSSMESATSFGNAGSNTMSAAFMAITFAVLVAVTVFCVLAVVALSQGKRATVLSRIAIEVGVGFLLIMTIFGAGLGLDSLKSAVVRAIE